MFDEEFDVIVIVGVKTVPNNLMKNTRKKERKGEQKDPKTGTLRARVGELAEAE